MKRRFLTAAAAVAAAAVCAGIAVAGTGTATPTGTPNTYEFQGTIKHPYHSKNHKHHHLVVQVWDGANCTGTIVDRFHAGSGGLGTVGPNGNFNFTYTMPAGATNGSVYVSGRPGHHKPWHQDSTCINVGGSGAGGAAGAAAAAPPPPPPNIFLCYSVDQTQPGVWPQDVAEQLLQQGYWLPYAVSGDASGGTNLGGYHLSCNIASTQSVSDSFVGGDGTVLGPAYAGDTVGLYPQVGG